MKSAGKRSAELRLVLKRVVELREGHRAAVVPSVDHRHRPARICAPQLSQSTVTPIDVGAVQVRGDFAPGPLASSSTEPTQESAPQLALAAAPNRQRRAPVAVARERPVDVVLQPFAEAAVLDVRGVPADRLVVGEQLDRGPAEVAMYQLDLA